MKKNILSSIEAIIQVDDNHNSSSHDILWLIRDYKTNGALYLLIESPFNNKWTLKIVSFQIQEWESEQ